MLNLIKVDIYKYSKFHKYLRDYYKENKSANPATFSYGFLAREGGFSGGAIVSRIFNNENTTLSTIHCLQLSNALGHSEQEAEYFRCIVALSQASHEKEIHFFEKMRQRIINRNDAKIQMIDKDRKEYYSEWYHSAIRALIDIFAQSKEEYVRLGSKLLLPITKSQTKKSIALLERLGFVEKGSDGIYTISTEKNIKTSDDFLPDDKKRFHLQYMKVAEHALTDNASGPQKVSSHVIGISRKTYEKICSDTDEFKNKINTLVEDEEKPDRAYLYQLIFVPLSKDIKTE
ncbi:MAG: TIGR02147 family protein [Chitinispirillaceae bacterium]|nr:TIGR02147 family protein [Chitinispirillaceae bacterium]